MRISVDIPDTFASKKANDRYFKEALVAVLYQIGDISSKEACEVLGVVRREFEEMLPRFGVSILSDDDENLAIELSA